MTETTSHHRLLFGDARVLRDVEDASVQLVVTSPPYPMIEMWDEGFAEGDAGVRAALDRGDGRAAFEAMHQQLDQVWSELLRVLEPGGMAAINIGDATRKLGEEFRLYPNHARILQSAMALGFSVLPDILWRKPTNAPNKFLGSGMLPGGAYVTYEHEYVLILRKGGPRVFKSSAEKTRRRRSAYFWEERNVWFSDLWTDLRGTSQGLGDPELRARSAAFPFELPYRLIQMYSLVGDTVLDPFLGTGTTMAAAIASGRQAIGIERDESFRTTVEAALGEAPTLGMQKARERLNAHRAFVANRLADGRSFKHHHAGYDVPVITAQERELTLVRPDALIPQGEGRFVSELIPVDDKPQSETAS